MRLLHVVNELTVGGGAVHLTRHLKDHVGLGHYGACITLEWGPCADELLRAGIEVYLLRSYAELDPILRDSALQGTTVAHGHSAGGGSEAYPIARKLQAEGLPCLGGGHVHSVVAGSDAHSDFEIAEIELMARLRPGIAIIPWAVPPERVSPSAPKAELRTLFQLPLDAPVIGRNGRLDGSKAPDEFVRCLAQLPECWGLLSGWGPEYDALRRLAQSLGCSDRLVMPGMCERPGDVFGACDVIVYPTYDESWCAGVVEPLAAAKPVVCYPVGGMNENVVHGETGLHAHSVPDLVESVRYFLGNPEFARQCGQRGKELLERKGALDPVLEAKRHLELYRKVAKRKGFPI